MNTTNTSNQLSIEQMLPVIVQGLLFILIVIIKFLNEKKLNVFLKNFFTEYTEKNANLIEDVKNNIEKAFSEKAMSEKIELETPQITERENMPYPSPKNEEIKPIFLDDIGKKIQVGNYIITIQTPRR